VPPCDYCKHVQALSSWGISIVPWFLLFLVVLYEGRHPAEVVGSEPQAKGGSKQWYFWAQKVSQSENTEPQAPTYQQLWLWEVSK
jgi:hypothetical protein